MKKSISVDPFHEVNSREFLEALLDGEEALHETYLAVHKGLSSFEGKSKLTTWIYSVAYPCSRIRAFVFEHAEGTLDPLVAARFRLHISKCKDCNEYVRIYRMTADIRSFRKSNPPPREIVDRARDFLEKNGIADFSEGPEGRGPTQV